MHDRDAESAQRVAKTFKTIEDLSHVNDQDESKVSAPCPVCASPQTRKAGELVGQRTGSRWDAVFCDACFSLSVKSDYIEDEATLAADLEWHKRNIERNIECSRSLLKELLSRKPEMRSVLEIGSGIGTFLSVASREFGLEADGYDINRRAIEWGNRHFGLSMKAEEWNASLSSGADLAVSLSCFEHIHEPRALISEMAAFARSHQAEIFISVPFFNWSRWEFLNEDRHDAEGSPFYTNDVHVTHFSFLGLVGVMEEFGLPCFEQIRSKGWTGFLFSESYPEENSRKMMRKRDRLKDRWKEKSLAMFESEDCPDSLKDSISIRS